MLEFIWQGVNFVLSKFFGLAEVSSICFYDFLFESVCSNGIVYQQP